MDIKIREIDQEVDDQTGEIISSIYHRRVIDCNSDVSNESLEIQAVANDIWTPEIITAWEEFSTAQTIE